MKSVYPERQLQGAVHREGFVRTPIVSPSGHACSFVETERRLAPLIRRVPITRLSDLSPLDPLGLPAWSAVTPLARDLATHNGKGRDGRSARISAIMEAIERTSGEALATERLVRASRRDLLARAELPPVDPESYNLPFETRYTPEAELSWTAGYDLIQQRTRLVPADLVWTPAREGVLFGIETNGLAAGNNLTEATVHALGELIERFSTLEHHVADLYADPRDGSAYAVRMIDGTSVPPDTRAWIDRIEAGGMRVLLRDERASIALPVFRAVIVDPHFGMGDDGDVRFAGWGADLDAARAVFRAVSEAVQARLAFVQGSRDTFDTGTDVRDRKETRRRDLFMENPTRALPFPHGSESTGDLLSDLELLVGKLVRAGFDSCLVVDVTRPDLGVPVVRVLVPDLISHEGNRRPPLRSLLRLV